MSPPVAKSEVRRPPPISRAGSAHRASPGHRRAALSACLLLAATLFAFGVQAFPVPMGDAVGFVPAAALFRGGQGLVNPLYETTLPSGDPLGRARFLYYPPLFPLAVGLLMPSADQGSALLVLGILRALALLGFAALLWRTMRRTGARLDRPLMGLFVLSLAGLCTGYTPAEGRPEALGSLWLLGATAVALELHGPWKLVGLGLSLGLMVATHLVGAILLATLIACQEGATRETLPACGRLLLVGALGLAVAVLVVLLGPYGLVETARGILSRSQSSVIAAWSEGTYPWNWWFASGRASFLGILLVAGVAAALAMAVRYRHQVRSPPIFWGSAALFLSATYYFSVRNPRFYNIQMFGPLLYGALLCFAALPGRALRAWRRRLLRLAALAVVALTATGFLRYAVLAVSGRSWISLEEGQQSFRSVERCPGRPIDSLGPSWMLPGLADLPRVRSYYSRQSWLESAGPCLLLSPADFDFQEELERHGYQLSAALPPPGQALRLPRPAWRLGYGYRLYELPPAAGSSARRP